MKNSGKKNICILFIAVATFAACNNAPQKENNADTVAAVISLPDTVAYTYTTLAKLEINDKIKDTSDLYRADITYPVITGTGVLAESINNTIRAALFNNKKTAREFADSFTTRPKDANNKIPVYNRWTYLAGMHVLMNNKRLFVLEANIYSYTGGAHGMSARLYYNLNMQGKQLQWNDILDTANTAQLEAINEISLRKAKEIPANQNWAEAGFFIDSAHLPLPAAFGFDNSGLIMTYNQYEIAPYAMGIITYTISYSKLEGIIKKEWLP